MRLRSSPLLLVVIVLLAVPAFTQGLPSGTITGHVVDVQGLALPGASVTVESPNLQGRRAVITSANGDYIVPFLPTGEYTVAFELTGFKTNKEKVRIAVGQTVSLSSTMSIATMTEEVTVVAQVVGEFTQTASVATSLKSDLVDKLPTNRNLAAYVNLAPGVQSTGPQGAFSISGAASFENQFLLNGVVIQDNIRGTPFQNLFIEDALQETTITTAAVSAEYGRFSGGVVNAVTKSGGNEYSGSYRLTFDNDKTFRSRSPYETCADGHSGCKDASGANVTFGTAGADPGDPRVDHYFKTHELTLGGPILKDKLWFFGAGRFRNSILEGAGLTSVTNIPFERGINEKRYEGKLTYSLNTNHRFSGAYTKISSDEVGNTFGTILDLDSIVHRQLPQQLISATYNGILTSNFFVEAHFANRKFTFENSGATLTDPIGGTLLLDRSRGNARYHSPTFCGVCDPEKRDNNEYLVKGSYFLSTSNLGSHNIVGGVDIFSDKRLSNNHQSGSDYRIFGTGAIITGTGAGSQIYPIFNNDGSTFIRWTPIFQNSQGTNFKTYSAYLNDQWRYNNRLTFNVGIRYDKNGGEDSVGNAVVKDSAFSPRLSVTVDPKGDGDVTLNASYAKYVAAIANSIGDSSSPGGQPATIDFDYLGPAVNVGNPANPVSQNDAIKTLFDWFNANGGTNRTTRGAPSIPGVTQAISGNLASPNVVELAAGATKRLGSRGLVRLDGVYRKYQDFYSTRLDPSTGFVTDSTGKKFDFTVVENTDDVERNYKGLNFQVAYRFGDRLTAGGNYTLSETKGNFNGENGPSGPITAGPHFQAEYFDLTWNGPVADLPGDVRHRTRVYATLDKLLPEAAGNLNLGLLYQFQTGSPYGGAGSVDTRPYVTNPGYINPPATVGYNFLAPDANRTANLHRVDLNLNYSHKLGFGKRTELFLRATVQNVLDRQKLTNLVDGGCGTGGCINSSVITRSNNSTFAAFNPFTTTPVQASTPNGQAQAGTNWNFGTLYGQPTSRFAYQSPRTAFFSLGIRF